VLLVDQISFGLVLPCLSAWMLIYYRPFSTLPPSAADSKAIRLQKVHKRIWLTSIAILILVLLIVLGRTPAAMVCDYQARESLAAGDYAQALRWLDTALVLNPALDQVVYYHEERGQALYYLHPDQQSDDSRVYLASTYRKQGDNLDAYQQLLEAWSSHHTPSWGVDAMSITLEKLAEFSQPLNSPPTQRPQNDDTALAWLQLLTQVDPSNVYGQYVVGRIQYDLHNYTACTTQMIMVIQLSPDANVQSSAYTYIALSDAGLGNDAEARKLLFKAIELDRSYRNNTAREELSGLH
jgi:tetratricopeptide (TPR) repeat protein